MKSPSPLQKYLTIDETSIRYSCGKTTIHALIRAGKLVTKKLGSRTLIDLEDADRFFDNLPSASAVRAKFKTLTRGR